MTLLVTYTTHAGQREVFLQKVLQSGLPELVRQEDGCLRYDYFLSAEHPEEILLVEQWATPEQQEHHLQQPHMARLQQFKAAYLAETTVQRL